MAQADFMQTDLLVWTFDDGLDICFKFHFFWKSNYRHKCKYLCTMHFFWALWVPPCFVDCGAWICVRKECEFYMYFPSVVCLQIFAPVSEHSGEHRRLSQHSIFLGNGAATDSAAFGNKHWRRSMRGRRHVVCGRCNCYRKIRHCCRHRRGFAPTEKHCCSCTLNFLTYAAWGRPFSFSSSHEGGGFSPPSPAPSDGDYP